MDHLWCSAILGMMKSDCLRPWTYMLCNKHKVINISLYFLYIFKLNHTDSNLNYTNIQSQRIQIPNQDSKANKEKWNIFIISQTRSIHSNQITNWKNPTFMLILTSFKRTRECLRNFVKEFNPFVLEEQLNGSIRVVSPLVQ